MNIHNYWRPAVSMAVAVLLLFILAACEDVESDSGFIEDANAPINESTAAPAKAAANQTAPETRSIPPEISPEKCGDGICQPSETKCTCTADCGECKGDASPTSEFRCADGKCKIATKEHICGNAVCDTQESPTSCPQDCPTCEPDNDPCTKDGYDTPAKACTHEPIIPCCGNKVCEPPGEPGSCLIDCKQSNLSLKDYPAPFVQNKQVNAFIVVGSQGTGADVTAGIDIIRGWEYNGSNPGYDTKARLDKELESIQDKNVILIGNACENTHVAALMKPIKDCRDGLEPGIGLLRVYQTGTNTYALVVAGYSSEEIRHAAKVLEKYKDYGLTGYQVEVR